MKWSLSSDSRIYPLFLSESRVLQPSFTFHPSLELAPTHDRVFSARNIHTFILQVLFIHETWTIHSFIQQVLFILSSFLSSYSLHIPFIHLFFHETCTIHSLLLQVLFIISFIHSSYILHTPSYSLHTPFIHFILKHALFIHSSYRYFSSFILSFILSFIH